MEFIRGADAANRSVNTGRVNLKINKVTASAQTNVVKEFGNMNLRPSSPDSVAGTNAFEKNSGAEKNAQLPEGWSIAEDPDTGNHYCYNAEGETYFIAQDDQGNQFYWRGEVSIRDLPTPSQKLTQKFSDHAETIRNDLKDVRLDTKRMQSEGQLYLDKEEAKAVLDGELTSLNLLKDSFTENRTEESNLKKQLQDIEDAIGELNQDKEALENELQKLEGQITSLENKALENKDDNDTLVSIETTSKNNLIQQNHIKNKLSGLEDQFKIVGAGKSKTESLYNKKVEIGDDLKKQLDIAKADYLRQVEDYQNKFLSDG